MTSLHHTKRPALRGPFSLARALHNCYHKLFRVESYLVQFAY